MNKLQVINYIIELSEIAPNYQTVVIGGNDDMTICEAVCFMCKTPIEKRDWNVLAEKNTILVY